MTDSTGRFSLDLPEGYAAYVVDLDDSQYVLDRPIVVLREALGEPITLRARRAAFVWGRVLDLATGAPVDGARVETLVSLPEEEAPGWNLAEARGRIEASMSRSASAHEDGRFQVMVRGFGRVCLVVVDDEHAPHFEHFDVKPGAGIDPIEVRLARGTRVLGRLVVRGDGHTVSDYRVSMARSPIPEEARQVGSPWSFICPDDQTGAFVVGHLSPGSYEIVIWTSRTRPATRGRIAFDVQEGAELLQLDDVVLDPPGVEEK